MITKRGQHIQLLERILGVTPNFDKCSYINFCWGYGHQMSAAGTPLGEESSGHLSPGTSDVITMQLHD